jgi:MFS family permease
MLMDISSEMIHGLLPIYLVTVMGTSATVVGAIEGVAEATALVTRVFSGSLSDWFGKRKLLATLGYGLGALSKPVFPLATSVGWLFAARFVDRIGKGVRGAPRDALVADITPPEIRGASFGLRQSLDTIGAFLGPGIAILLMLATANNFRLVFWLAVPPAFLAVALLVLAVREPSRDRTGRLARFPLHIRELRRLGPTFWSVAAVATVFTLARFSEAFLLLRAQSVGLPIALSPAVLVLMNVAYAASAYPAGKLSDRIGRKLVFVPGLALLIAADLALATASSLWGVGLGVALWGLHMGFTQGLVAALIADAAPADLRGTAYGALNLLTGIGALGASVLAGVLWDSIGPQAVFATGAALALLALIGVAAVGPVRRGS